MNRLLVLILSVLPGLSVMAQTPEDYHFSVKDGYATWQLVYETAVDEDAVLDYLLGSGNFTDVTNVTSGFSFTIAPRAVDWRLSGIQRAYTPMYILNYQMTGHGLLQIRDGRYRVTVDHVTFLDNPSVAFETYVLNKQSEFRGVFTAEKSNAAAILDYDFTKLFTMPEQAEEETW